MPLDGEQGDVVALLDIARMLANLIIYVNRQADAEYTNRCPQMVMNWNTLLGYCFYLKSPAETAGLYFRDIKGITSY